MMWRPRLAAVLVLLSAGAARPAAAADNPFAAQYVQLLSQAGIKTDAEGLRTFLELHHSGSEQQKRYQSLVDQLGDKDFFAREEAMLQLMRSPIHTSGLLEKALKEGDLEVRWRAQVVLDETAKPRNDLLYAAFVVINDRRISGLAEPVIGTLPVCRSDHVRLALSRALEATVVREDEALLREFLKAEQPEARVVAATALRRCIGDEADAALAPLLEDPADTVKVAAAEILLPRQRAPALATLARLLASESLSVRNRSIQLLRSSTDVDLPYSGYEPVEDRARHAEAWQKAIQELNEAVQKATSSVDPAIGPEELQQRLAELDSPFLIDAYQKSTLISWTRGAGFQFTEGPPVFSYVRPAAGGHRLIAAMRDQKVTEVDAAGGVVWEAATPDFSPLVIDRTIDGRYLVLAYEGALLEFGSDHRLTRKRRLNGNARDLRLLPNGETLVLFVNGIVRRFDDDGRELWKSEPILNAVSLSIIDGDRFFVVVDRGGDRVGWKTGQVLEFDREGGQTILQGHFNGPMQVQLLPDGSGNLAVVDVEGLHVVERSGALVKTIRRFDEQPLAKRLGPVLKQ